MRTSKKIHKSCITIINMLRSFRKNPMISRYYENAMITETKRQVSCTIVQKIMETATQYSLKIRNESRYPDGNFSDHEDYENKLLYASL